MVEPRLVAMARGTDDAGLDADEVHLLALLATGLPVESVARRLNLSSRTVRRRCRAVCDKVGVCSPVSAVAWAARRGII